MHGISLVKGTPWKLILRFAMPVFAGNLLQQLYNTVDTVVVGRYINEGALSAVGTTACLTMFFIALANGFSAGAGVLIAQNYGAGREEAVRKNAATSILLMLAMGAAATLLGIGLCKPVLVHVLAVPAEFLESAVLYFRIYCLGLIFQFGYNIVSAILRAVGDSMATFLFLLIAAVINIVLDIVFIAVLHWGVAGAAIATGIAQACSCAASFAYMWIKYPVFRGSKAQWAFDPHIAWDVLRTGFPIALMQIIVSFGFVFMQRAVNGYGKYMTASFTVEQRIENYLLMPAMAFQIAMVTYCGQNIGAGRMDRVLQGIRQTIVLSELFTVCISLAVYFGTEPIVRLFQISKDAAFYCVPHLKATALMLPLFAGFFPVQGLFQGVGDGFSATLIAMVGLGIRVVSTYTLCYLPLFDYRIIWWSVFFNWVFGFSAAWTHFLRGKWKTKTVIKQSKPDDISAPVLQEIENH